GEGRHTRPEFGGTARKTGGRGDHERRRGARGGGRQARARRCRTASYSTTVVALAALSELAEPSIGMLTMTSHASRQPALSPVVSLPVRTSVGPVRSCSASSTSPCSSVPSRVNGTPAERCASTHASTSRPAGTRTVGTEKDRKSTRLNSSHVKISY